MVPEFFRDCSELAIKMYIFQEKFSEDSYTAPGSQNAIMKRVYEFCFMQLHKSYILFYSLNNFSAGIVRCCDDGFERSSASIAFI